MCCVSRCRVSVTEARQCFCCCLERCLTNPASTFQIFLVLRVLGQILLPFVISVDFSSLVYYLCFCDDNDHPSRHLFLSILGIVSRFTSHKIKKEELIDWFVNGFGGTRWARASRCTGAWADSPQAAHLSAKSFTNRSLIVHEFIYNVRHVHFLASSRPQVRPTSDHVIAIYSNNHHLGKEGLVKAMGFQAIHYHWPCTPMRCFDLRLDGLILLVRFT